MCKVLRQETKTSERQDCRGCGVDGDLMTLELYPGRYREPPKGFKEENEICVLAVSLLLRCACGVG